MNEPTSLEQPIAEVEKLLETDLLTNEEIPTVVDESSDDEDEDEDDE